MASTLNALTTGGGGIVATGDSSGVMQLQTNNGTTAVTIDTSQNVGIGTASPTSNLDVQTASGQATINVVGGTGRGNVQLSTGAADGSGVSVGFLGFFGGESTSGSGETRVAGIATTTEGATANHRGGRITFNTKADNVAVLSERMRIDSSGNVLVGTTTASGKTTILQSSNGLALNIGNENVIEGTYYGAVQITRPADPTGNAFHLSFVRTGNKVAGMGFLDNSNTFAIQNTNDNTGAGVTLTNAATSWGTTSDERKKDIVGNVEDALSKIADWRCVYYKYKSDEENTQQRVGLIAQDVQKTLPEAISIEEDELQTLQLRYTETIPVLVKAIQEQQTIIQDLKARIETLEAK